MKKTNITSLLLLLVFSLLSGCGGGADTETNPVTQNSGALIASQYNGPNALTNDIRAFQVSLWEPLRGTNRCGACHTEGNQDPEFVRLDDINAAYRNALPLVDLDNPDNSRMVDKVRGGHNCWLSSNAACAAAITTYIENWANGINGGAGRQIALSAPPQNAPGATLAFPADSNGFATHVWPILTTNCASCHRETAATPQSPFFASSNVDDAYEAAKSKIDLNNPSSSRLVVRLGSEFHNCWSDCDDDANSMQAAIQAYADTLTANSVSAPVVFSNATRLTDGIVAAGGNRFETNQIALYEFKTGSGNVALDTSGVGTELNLTLNGSVNWVGGFGVEILDGKLQGSTTASRKLHELITATGEYSIEAWVVPANVTQEGPARIISYSGSATSRNFTLAQTQYNYDFLHRSSTTDNNGQVALSTDDADEDLQAVLQHVVVTFDPVVGRRIYVNGVDTGDTDPVNPGNLNDWDDSFAFVIGNEVSNDRQWQGIVRMAAIHNRALTPQQVIQNFDVGVGEKFFLLFGISDLIGLPESFIVFEVSQFDNYSYLFNEPNFVSLDPDVIPNSIPLEKMRIGINGKEAIVGQAYRNLITTLNNTDYDPAIGQQLSPMGTIISLENGPTSDEFFLTFELLGSNTNVVTETSNLTPPTLPGPGTVADIGLRTFDEVNASMSAVTGVDIAEPSIRTTYETIRQQLPVAENFSGFVSSHQIGITQLAIGYCNALVESSSLRNAFFDQTIAAGFNFSANVYDAFSSNEQLVIADDLYINMVGVPGNLSSDITSAPTSSEIIAELSNISDSDGDGIGDGLYQRLRETCPDPEPNPVPAICNAERTRTIVKAMCASVLGSASMLIQ